MARGGDLIWIVCEVEGGFPTLEEWYIYYALAVFICQLFIICGHVFLDFMSFLLFLFLSGLVLPCNFSNFFIFFLNHFDIKNIF